MITEIAAAATAAKHAYELVKGIGTLHTETEKNAAIIDVQQSIIDVQRQLAEAQHRYDELAQQKRKSDMDLAARDEWAREAARYKLRPINTGVFVYALTASDGEVKHWLCAHCFQERRKSILQWQCGYTTYVCPRCNSVIDSGTGPDALIY